MTSDGVTEIIYFGLSDRSLMRSPVPFQKYLDNITLLYGRSPSSHKDAAVETL